MLKITLDKAAIDRLLGPEVGGEIEVEMYKAVSQKIHELLQKHKHKVETVTKAAFAECVGKQNYMGDFGLTMAAKQAIQKEALMALGRYMTESPIAELIEKAVAAKVEQMTAAAIQARIAAILGKIQL